MTDSLNELKVNMLPTTNPESVELKVCYLKAVLQEETCSKSFRLCYEEMFVVTFDEASDLLSIPRAPNY